MEQIRNLLESDEKNNPWWFLAHRYSAKCPGMGTIWTKIFSPHQTKCKLENRKTHPHIKTKPRSQMIKERQLCTMQKEAEIYRLPNGMWDW